MQNELNLIHPAAINREQQTATDRARDESLKNIFFGFTDTRNRLIPQVSQTTLSLNSIMLSTSNQWQTVLQARKYTNINYDARKAVAARGTFLW